MIRVSAYYPRSKGGGDGCDFEAYASDRAAAMALLEGQVERGAILVAFDGDVVVGPHPETRAA